MVMTQAKVDWLTLTKKGKVAGVEYVENYREALLVAREIFYGFGITDSDIKPVRSEGFYPWVFGFESRSETVGVPSDLLVQGVRYIAPGQAHNDYARTQTVIEIARDQGWTFTRVDVAFDVFGETLDYEELTAVVKLFYPRKKRSVNHKRGTEGDTLYIGSGSSDNYCRIYDKGAQQRSARPWHRVELQIRGDTAKALGRMRGDLLTNGTSHMAAWLGEIPHWIITDVRSWAQHNPERVQPLHVAQTDRAVWFNNTVMKAMYTWAQAEPDEARRWHESVSRMLDILKNRE